MTRIAYIFPVHADAPHLARMIAALDDGMADFYVHVDSKVDDRPFRNLLAGKAVFVPSHWISWGGWSQVEYQKELLGAVLQSGRDYGRVVSLSGLDYPLWSNADIHRCFDSQPEQEFIMGANLTRCSNSAQRRKFMNYHFFRDLQWRNQWWKNKLIVVSRNLLKWLPVRKPPVVKLRGGGEMDVYFGSEYWALTLPCARYVYERLCDEKALEHYFKTAFAPSELCVQTIVFNSPFASRALRYEGEYPGLGRVTPLHHIQYGKSIRIWTESDLPLLKQSGKMFCRKLVTGVSDGLADRIDRMRGSE